MTDTETIVPALRSRQLCGRAVSQVTRFTSVTGDFSAKFLPIHVKPRSVLPEREVMTYHGVVQHFFFGGGEITRVVEQQKVMF